MASLKEACVVGLESQYLRPTGVPPHIAIHKQLHDLMNAVKKVPENLQGTIMRCFQQLGLNAQHALNTQQAPQLPWPVQTSCSSASMLHREGNFGGSVTKRNVSHPSAISTQQICLREL
mmetsp:Transcript_11000/g.27788  ORF Transcript_11000/g.27788 Transcript_11000/m.27788 type:complete len:119 (-) Transcript_11000:205-561(-)